jgi:hypothetical protein
VNTLFSAAVDIQALCAAQGWKCCVIGGLAVQRWGEPRQTRDVDLTLFTGLGREEQFVDPILTHYAARLPRLLHGRARFVPRREAAAVG